MYIAIYALALPEKKEVIVPSLTYRRMADIIDWAGLAPRFCDVDPGTLGISAETILPCINENTALILAPHPITRLCDIDGIEKLAHASGLPLMFDSVEACGGSHDGKMIGGFGLCESFSMHPSKVLNSCEGGYITTNDSTIARKLRKMRAFGFSARDHIDCLGTNAKLNELHAAMGLASLVGFEQQRELNKKIHLAYQKNLADIPGIHVVPYALDEKRNWKSVLVRQDSRWPLNRTATLNILNAENIHARPYYSPAQHTTFLRQAGKGEIPLPVTVENMGNHFILPFGSTVSEQDTAAIGEFFHAILHFHEEIQMRMEREI